MEACSLASGSSSSIYSVRNCGQFASLLHPYGSFPVAYSERQPGQSLEALPSLIRRYRYIDTHSDLQSVRGGAGKITYPRSLPILT